MSSFVGCAGTREGNPATSRDPARGEEREEVERERTRERKREERREGGKEGEGTETSSSSSLLFSCTCSLRLLLTGSQMRGSLGIELVVAYFQPY